MANLDGVITKLNERDAELSADITASWDKMMYSASIRGIIRARTPILRFLKVLGDGSKVKKHSKKLKSYFVRINAIGQEELNSKNYIKRILTPLKEIRTEFTAWVKDGSLKNVIDEADIKYILNKSRIVADATADKVVGEIEAAVEEAKAA